MKNKIYNLQNLIEDFKVEQSILEKIYKKDLELEVIGESLIQEEKVKTAYEAVKEYLKEM